MMPRTRHIAAMLAALILLALASACSKQEVGNGRYGDGRIRWKMNGPDGFNTRSLIEDRGTLETACTPIDDGGKGAGIGIWADYEIDIDNVTYRVNDVFKGTELIYDPDSTDPQTQWDYKGDPAYWTPGGKYRFRAYYPKDGINIHEESTASLFMVEYNTTTTQSDLLLAYKSFDTTSDKMEEPVELTFSHAMSALRFIFKFYDGEDNVFLSEDSLTSCWLEPAQDNALAATAIMAYGNGKDDDEGLVQWILNYYPSEGDPIYYWEYPEGIPFSNVKTDESTIQTTRAIAYSLSSGSGDNFTDNEGWLVIIPQESSGKLNLCFTTKVGKDVVFRVPIPAVTGTSYDRYAAGEDPLVDGGTDFIPGWRYTYSVAITKTDANIVLSLSPWNRIDSSFDITL